MFLVEIGAGVAAGSASLQADALDFFGDAANYASACSSSAWRCAIAPSRAGQRRQHGPVRPVGDRHRDLARRARHLAERRHHGRGRRGGVRRQRRLVRAAVGLSRGRRQHALGLDLHAQRCRSAISRCCWPRPACSGPEPDGRTSPWPRSWRAWRCRAPDRAAAGARRIAPAGSRRRASLARGPASRYIAAPACQGEHAMLERTPPQFRELQEITMQTDTRDILAHATRQAESYEDYFLVDIDAHVTETSFWPEILAMIDNDVIRQMGQADRRPPRQRQRRAAQQLAGHSLSARLRPHSAPAGAAGEGREERHPSFRRAGAPLDGRARPRLSGRVSDADADARHASAGRHRGGARRGLQQVAGRAHPAGGRSPQGHDLPAVQHARGLRRGGQEVRRRRQHHRLFGRARRATSRCITTAT